MAVSILNFSQQAQEQQQMIRDRMRSFCPQTAALGDRLTVRPVELGEVPPAPPTIGGSIMISPVHQELDRRMYVSDMMNAQNTQRLTGLLGQACAQEMLTGQGASLPPFLQPGR